MKVNKVNILLELSERLINTKKYNKEEIYIYFNHDYTKRDTTYFALGYGQFEYWDWEHSKSSKETISNGLKLVIRDRDLDIPQLLNLINSAFQNIEYIKTKQKQLIIDRHSTTNGIAQYDTLSSVSSSIIKSYSSTVDSLVKELISEKTYRRLKRTDESGVIDYYFKDNQFHIYGTRDPEREWYQEQSEYYSKKFGQDILVVDNILEIFGSYNDGHFVFVNDSVFYFIPQLQDKISGPFLVDSIRAGRPPVEKFYHEYSPIDRYTLFFDNYRGYKKAIFFPDSNVLVSNFDNIENKFITGLLQDQQTHIEVNSTNAKFLILLGALILSVLLNFWFWTNRQK